MKMKSFLIRVRVSLSVNGTRFRRLDETSLETVYADGIGWRQSELANAQIRVSNGIDRIKNGTVRR